MKTPLIILFTIFALAISVMAQTKPGTPSADVSSIDGILKAVYDVISGDAGQTRDWARFRSLFHKEARLIPTGKAGKSGGYNATVLTPDNYIARVEPVFAKQGFYEREKARRVERFGSVAQVFSTYESFHGPKDEKPFMRGINSFQLFYDGRRWWVMSIFWQAETAETQIPSEFLKNKS
ncbi:MAG: hypothetical protein ABI539_15590 [Acidobacteriota bacterium]